MNSVEAFEVAAVLGIKGKSTKMVDQISELALSNLLKLSGICSTSWSIKEFTLFLSTSFLMTLGKIAFGILEH